MKPLTWLWRRLCSFGHRQAVKRDIDEELQFHLEQRTADNLAAGMTPEDAAREARKRFGNWQSVREDCREARGASFGETTLQDVRFGARMLRKNPGFTAVAVISLALGIGAGTAVFSLVNAILLRSLPVPDPQALRVLRWAGTDARVYSLSEWPVTAGNRSMAHSVSHPLFLAMREAGGAEADIFGFAPLQDVTARLRSEAVTARGVMVSDNFFAGLGVRPLIGRSLNAVEDYGGAPTSVVLAYEWWERHFARDPAVLGQPVQLNGTSFTVVGVLPPGFSGVVPGDPSEFYVPLAAGSQFLYMPLTDARNWFVRLMARVKPGASDAALGARLAPVLANAEGASMKEPRVLVEPGGGGLAIDRNRHRKPLLLMLGVVGLVMLVACANLGGLSLARGAARQHELAVRAALGASRWRLVRQSLTESLVLAWLGGGCGLLVALWAKSAISRLLAGSPDGLRYDVSLSPPVLGFSLAAALAAAVLSGLFPAWLAGRVDAAGGLKSRSALGAPRLRIGRALVTAQICLSLLLVTGAGLYLRSLANLTRIDAGFNTERLLLFQLNPAGLGYDGAQRLAFYDRVQEALSAIPGVRGATLVENPPLSNQASAGGFVFSDRPGNAPREYETFRQTVGESFFATMGIALLRGRALSVTDTETAPKVMVVNETFVRNYLPEENPLGRRVRIWGADWQIVGVCGDAKYLNLKDAPPPTAYFPFRQRLYGKFRETHLGSAYFALRTALPPLALTTAARATVAALNPNVPLAHITTQAAIRDRGISQERLLAVLCGALAGLALLLSCVGLYGLMAYHVARRTGEIGLRMALGASRSQIAGPIHGESLRLAAIGVTLGLAAALGLARLVRSQLYGVEPTDPLTLASAALILLAVAVGAAWAPARRAARVDPIQALRDE